MLYKNILQDIKNKKLIDYENLNSIKLKITVSQENYEKLQQNLEGIDYTNLPKNIDKNIIEKESE